LYFFAQIFCMWQSLAKVVIKNRVVVILVTAVLTVVMAYFASKASIGYEFTKAVPTDNAEYVAFEEFKRNFGDDGNVIVLGVTAPNFFELKHFNAYAQLNANIKKLNGVEGSLDIPNAFNLVKNIETEKLTTSLIFPPVAASQAQLDSAVSTFYSLPFYKNRLYNPATKSYLMAVKVNKQIFASKERAKVVEAIDAEIAKYETATGNKIIESGLPLIRTKLAVRIQEEMKLFLFASLALSVLVLFIFFRSIATTLLSMFVVVIGVLFSLAIIYLMGYQISLLTALIPSLIVVIGIPNCIYFINKYHTSFVNSSISDVALRKQQALVDMVSKMGVVTLFCNITAAIGFAVFAFTNSPLLKEFGVVASVNIMLIFFISFALLPSVLSFMPAPTTKELKYLKNTVIEKLIAKLLYWVQHKKMAVYGTTAAVVIMAIIGLFKLETNTYIVDDLPKKDELYTNLKYFEQNFKGIMPLEIIIDAKKRKGISGSRALLVFEKVDSLAQFIAQQPEMNNPLSIAEGLKFAKQAFYEGDSANYVLPNSFDGAFVGEYLRPNKDTASAMGNGFTKTLRSFMDSTNQRTRVSVNMADVGSKNLPALLQKIQNRSNQIFDTTYKVTFTGTSITFLEGSKFIINGLKESIYWAFGLIAVCMLFLFKSARILACSLIPNIIPLLTTAGIMGWFGVPLKPSTVLIFSVALGIAIDITIRFLVNYKQILPNYKNDVATAVNKTIEQTSQSIIYTSLVLTAGFVIFSLSKFGGTQALGWLTSITLLVATITNLLLLPVLLLWGRKKVNN
jgi:uncharacterized protein